MAGEIGLPQDPLADIADGARTEYIPAPYEEMAGAQGITEAAAQEASPVTTDLEELYRKYCRELGRLSYLLTSSAADAEDVVIDVFVTIAERYDIEDIENPRAFLRAAVVNRSRSMLRHRVVVDKNAPKSVPHAPSAEEGALDQLERYDLVAAVRQLPERQREAIVLRYYLDLSEVEIAQAMGVRLGTVKGHTSRAIATLRRMMILGS